MPDLPLRSDTLPARPAGLSGLSLRLRLPVRPPGADAGGAGAQKKKKKIFTTARATRCRSSAMRATPRATRAASPTWSAGSPAGGDWWRSGASYGHSLAAARARAGRWSARSYRLDAARYARADGPGRVRHRSALTRHLPSAASTRRSCGMCLSTPTTPDAQIERLFVLLRPGGVLGLRWRTWPALARAYLATPGPGCARPRISGPSRRPRCRA